MDTWDWLCGINGPVLINYCSRCQAFLLIAMQNGTSDTIEQKSTKLKWGPASALLVTLAAYLASQFIIVFPMIIISALNANQKVGDIIDNNAWVSLALGGLSAATLFIVLWLFLKSRKSSVKDLGFKKFTLKDFLWMLFGLGIYFVLLMLALLIANLVPGFNEDQVQNVGYTSAAGWQLAIAFIGLVIIPPLAEEMLFRGFLYRGLASKWPKIIAALTASVLFAVVHFQWNVGVDVFVLSLVMIFLLEKTKNLWVCVGLHAIKNAIAFLAIFVFVSS
jgi:uncharacterized protein